LGSALPGKSQPAKVDTAQANRQFSEAHQLQQKANYEASAALAEKAANDFFAKGFSARSARCLNIAASNFRLMENLDRAEQFNDKAIAHARKAKPSSAIEEIKALLNLGLIFSSRTNYEEGLSYLHDAESLAIENSAKPTVMSEIAAAFGYIYDEMGDYDTALEYYNEAINNLGSLSGAPKAKLAKLYNNMGVAYKNKGNFKRALSYYEKGVKLTRERYGENHPNVAGGYINLGATAFRNGDYGLAISYFKNALRSLKKSLGDHPMTAMAANNIGSSYMKLQNNSEAVRYLKQAIAINIDTRGPNHPVVAVNYKSLGDVYSRMEKDELAREYYERALGIEQRRLGNDHPQLAETFLKIGSTYVRAEEADKGIEYLQKAEGLVTKFSGSQHPRLAQIHQKMGEAYTQEKLFDKALEHFHTGLAIISKSAGDGLTNLDAGPAKPSDFEFPSFAVELLYEKGKTLNAYYKENSRNEFLAQSLQTFLLLSDLLDQLQRQYTSEESKLLVGKKSHDMYEPAIDVSYQMFKRTKNNAYLEQALYFSEKSKSRVLLETLQRDEGAAFAGVPDRLIKKEKDLRRDIAEIQRQIFRATDEAEEEGDDQLKNQLFDKSTELEAHIGLLKNRYPDYYNFKYENRVPELSEIQQKLKNKKLTLIEYFRGDSTIYAIVVTPSEITVVPVPVDQALESDIADFPDRIMNTSSDFTAAGHRLYTQLIEPLEPHFATEKLLVVPDGELARIPFEALLTAAVNEGSVSDYPFLMKKYRVNYSGSISLSKVLDTPKKRTYSSSLLAFAPSFSNASYPMQNTERNNWQPLLTSTYEVNEIASLFEGQASGYFDYFFGSAAPAATFMDDKATENAFKKAPLSDYRIIHLATHAFASETANAASGIVFSHEPDTEDDGILYSNEIYSLTLNNELAVLSACDTGRGAIVEGEGIMGLSRAFQYAGTTNLLMSLWKVEDRSTTRLMINFYQNVLNGDSYASALQQAKSMLSKNPIYAHPKYWAAFVLYGN
jgi:CHAT domain-containing protein/Tfp pilus assembly protein PilF